MPLDYLSSFAVVLRGIPGFSLLGEKNSLIPPPVPTKFLSLPTKTQSSSPSSTKWDSSSYNPMKTSFLAVVIVPVPFLFFDVQVMLILILIDVQYSQNTVFSFGKGSNSQNHSSSGSRHPGKKIPPSKISDFPHPLTLFGKPRIQGKFYICQTDYSTQTKNFPLFWSHTWKYNIQANKR